MNVRSDGNGGFNVNVQKRHLKRFWWVPLAFGIAGSGGGGVLADRIFTVLYSGESNAAAIEVVDGKVEDVRRDLTIQIEGIKTDQTEFRAENLEELRALRHDILQLHSSGGTK